jgi:hypothetical protein
LTEFKAFDANKSKSSREIIDKYHILKEQHPDHIPDILDATFSVYLSRNSNDQSSRINCPGRKQGYFLDQMVEEVEGLTEEVQSIELEEDLKKDIILEKNLYHYIKEWLFEKNHDRVADISNLKGNGKWGNPDLIGLKVEEIFGRPEIEVTTVEVKITEEGWERWIFEAVAHTRFADKSYFSFVYPENLVNKLDSTGLHLYAEHFNIGVLIMAVDNEDYLKIKQKEPVTLDGRINIIEYRHAPNTKTHIKFRKQFLESLGILEIRKLYLFGETLG